MSKQNLNEQLNRIKQLLNINESSVIEEAGNPIMDVIRKLVPGLEAKITTALETELGKALTSATDKEIEIALKSATMAAARKELAVAIYAAEKNMIDDVFKKYNMSVATEASKAYSELQQNGLNKGILKDIVGEWKAGGKGASSSVTPPPPPPPVPAPKPPKPDPVNTFKIPDFEVEIPNFWKLDEKATRAALKNVFPKASSSEIEGMVVNLRKMKLTNQADFEVALKNAIAAFGPEYQEILTKTSNWSKVSSKYAALPNWGKWIFWIAAAPAGYGLMKMVGIPVDKTLGTVIDGWKGIFKDQVSSVTGDTSSNNSSSGNQTSNIDDSVQGLRNFFIQKYEGYDNASANALDIKPLGSGKYEVAKDGKKLTYTYSNGTFTLQ
jgi:hypothetical protein